MVKGHVAVIKVASPDMDEEVVEVLERAVNLLGGLEKFVGPGDKVVVKPNLLLPRPAATVPLQV